MVEVAGVMLGAHAVRCLVRCWLSGKLGCLLFIDFELEFSQLPSGNPLGLGA